MQVVMETSIVFLAVLLLLIAVFIARKLKIDKSYNALYVLITGCDTGFGRELAYRLDKLGFNVIATCLTDAGAKILSQTTSENLHTVMLDVTKLDQIVNLHEKCLDVNLFGMTEMNRQFLPLLRNSRGRIINMVSMAGRMAVPSMTREVRCQGVSVHVIEPGIFDTKLLIKNADFEDAISSTFQQVDEKRQEYYGFNFPATEGTRLTIFRHRASSSRTYQVVDAYVDALTARFPKTRYVVGLDAWACTLFMKLPEWIIDTVVSKFGTYPAGVKKD
ncbi:hypothetical protein KUTeg_008727 [Tegillarca granosa]|uniref:Uncharacterized protein n=1 Tax=Tegillarca granosa TaxID=220873 RepID=A0ABQ9FA18_TEGGR|nr:hypothetical protein KUTeg_008727 [Tegillarca granosa]